MLRLRVIYRKRRSTIAIFAAKYSEVLASLTDFANGRVHDTMPRVRPRTDVFEVSLLPKTTPSSATVTCRRKRRRHQDHSFVQR
jgi:hypothetical protein